MYKLNKIFKNKVKITQMPNLTLLNSTLKKEHLLLRVFVIVQVCRHFIETLCILYLSISV